MNQSLNISKIIDMDRSNDNIITLEDDENHNGNEFVVEETKSSSNVDNMLLNFFTNNNNSGFPFLKNERRRCSDTAVIVKEKEKQNRRENCRASDTIISDKKLKKQIDNYTNNLDGCAISTTEHLRERKSFLIVTKKMIIENLQKSNTGTGEESYKNTERKSFIASARQSFKDVFQNNNNNDKVDDNNQEAKNMEEKIKEQEVKENLRKLRHKLNEEGVLTHLAVRQFLKKEKINQELLNKQKEVHEELKSCRKNKIILCPRLINSMVCKKREKNDSSNGFDTHETFLSKAMKQNLLNKEEAIARNESSSQLKMLRRLSNPNDWYDVMSDKWHETNNEDNDSKNDHSTYDDDSDSSSDFYVACTIGDNIDDASDTDFDIWHKSY